MIRNSARSLLKLFFGETKKSFQFRSDASANRYCHNPTGNIMLKFSPAINLSVHSKTEAPFFFNALQALDSYIKKCGLNSKHPHLLMLSSPLDERTDTPCKIPKGG